MLACESDWALMMSSFIHINYAVHRTNEHIQNAVKIIGDFASHSLNVAWLLKLSQKNILFEGIPTQDLLFPLQGL